MKGAIGYGSVCNSGTAPKAGKQTDCRIIISPTTIPYQDRNFMELP
jgi:hypothetical protein